jgi:hypothetical protein
MDFRRRYSQLVDGTACDVLTQTELLRRQGGQCPMCQRELCLFGQALDPRELWAYRDHDHGTGQRGLAYLRRWR